MDTSLQELYKRRDLGHMVLRAFLPLRRTPWTPIVQGRRHEFRVDGCEMNEIARLAGAGNIAKGPFSGKTQA
jgi:hypothetical protein